MLWGHELKLLSSCGGQKKAADHFLSLESAQRKLRDQRFGEKGKVKDKLALRGLQLKNSCQMPVIKD